MQKVFYANGKLLITAEYLVLEGAKALALPTKKGQFLYVNDFSEEKVLYWKSYDADKSIWFEAQLSFIDIQNNQLEHSQLILGTSAVLETLLQILHNAHLMNDAVLQEKGYFVETQLTFPRNWGLGTSSTVLYNISQWFQIDGYSLLKNSFGGSGYDIACAQYCTPILYELQQETPKVTAIHWKPDYTKNIYFVYLNVKQNSKNAIEKFKAKAKSCAEEIVQISAISNAILAATTLEEFEEQIKLHNAIVSQIIEETPVQNLFPDFDGVLKNLGAWGGDFIMVTSKQNPKDYFNSKGFNEVFSFEEFIL